MYVLMHMRKRLLQTKSHLPPRMGQASPHPTTTSCPITDTHVNMHYHIYIYIYNIIYSSCLGLGIDHEELLRMRESNILPTPHVRNCDLRLLAWPAWGRAGSNSPGSAQKLDQGQLIHTGAESQRRCMAPSNSRHTKCQPSSGTECLA